MSAELRVEAAHHGIDDGDRRVESANQGVRTADCHGQSRDLDRECASNADESIGHRIELASRRGKSTNRELAAVITMSSTGPNRLAR